MRPILKGSTDQSVVIRIVDSGDGTPETAVEHNTSGIDLWYRREGATKTSLTEAALAALDSAHSDGGIEHIGDGYYRLDLPDAAVASGANGVMVGGTVTGMVVIGCYVPLVDFNPYDGVRLGLTALPNAAADAAGGLPISDAGGLDLDARLDAAVSTRLASASYTAPPSAASIRAEMDANSTDLDAIGALATAIKAKTDNLAFTVANRVDSQVLGVQSAAANLKKNTAFSAFEFVMTDSTNHNPATGLTVTATRSIDGAAFGACANAVAEVASGVYKIDLAAADLNGNAITLRFTATGADDRLITVITQP